MDVRSVQQERTDPIRKTPQQRYRHDEIRVDPAVRILQPSQKGPGWHVELLRHRFSGVAIALHQHVKGFDKSFRKAALVLQLCLDIIHLSFVDEILQIEHRLLHVIRVVIHPPEDISPDVFLFIDPCEAKAALIHMPARPRRQHMSPRSLVYKSRLVAHNMPIRIDEFPAVQQFSEVEILLVQTARRHPVDVEGVLAPAQRFLIKAVWLDPYPVHIVQRALGVNMPQLYHPRTQTEMRNVIFLGNGQTDLLVFLPFMGISIERSTLFRHDPPHEVCGQHQAVCAAVRLFLHPVDRVGDLSLVLRYLELLCLHAQQVIVVHLLQAKKQTVFVVMDALVIDIEIRIFFFYRVRVDHDGIGRDAHLLRRFFVFRRGHEIIDQEKDAVHPFVLVKRHILDGKTHRFGERTSFAQFRVCKRSRDVCLPDAFGLFVHLFRSEIRYEKRTQQRQAVAIRRVVLGRQFLYRTGQRPRKLCREPETQVSAPFPNAILRTEQQRDLYICPEVEAVDPPIVDAPKSAYFPVDLPVHKAEADKPFQLASAKAVIEIRIHAQTIVVKQVLGH